MNHSKGPTVDPSHRWVTPGINPGESARLERQNLASLDRKITYCLNRTYERLQWQTVENWTTGQILDRMRSRGISEERIQRDFYGRVHR
jgi:hypothetical protein